MSDTTSQNTTGPGLGERAPYNMEVMRRLFDQFSFDMRVACPGIIRSFDATKQTVTVQPSVRERIVIDGNTEDMAIPLLVDIPIFMLRAGGMLVTVPVQAGDECLVIFGDSCIDSWYQSGGVQNNMDSRRHDLSDGFALIGPWSQPRVISNYSTENVQVRDEAGDNVIEITPAGHINITAVNQVNITSESANITATDATLTSESLNIAGSGTCIIGGGGTTTRYLVDQRLMTLYNNHLDDLHFGMGTKMTLANCGVKARSDAYGT